MLAVAPTKQHEAALLLHAKEMEDGIRSHRRLSIESSIVYSIQRLYNPDERLYVTDLAKEVNAVRGVTGTSEAKTPEYIGRLILGELGIQHTHGREGNYLIIDGEKIKTLFKRYLGAEY